MAFPANPTAHPFVPRSGCYSHTQAYPHNFVNFSDSDHSSVACQQCSNNAIVATNLQTRVSVLDMQLSKIQKENADAEMTIRYLLGLNAGAKNEHYAIYSARQVASELRYRLKQEVAEKECIKVMLESALNKIVHLHRARELESSRPSVSSESTLFEHDISSVAGVDDTNDVHHTETPEKEPRGEGVAISVQDFSKLESDSASASSYMFHFVNDSSEEDKIIMMVRVSAVRLTDTS